MQLDLFLVEVSLVRQLENGRYPSFGRGGKPESYRLRPPGLGVPFSDSLGSILAELKCLNFANL